MIPSQWLTEAHDRIRSAVQQTPLGYDERNDLLVKWENRQVTGSFKARGALNRLLGAAPGEAERGLVCASAGNHGHALARGARQLGVQVEVFVGENAAPVKIAAMRALGAVVHVVPGGYAEAEAAGRLHASESQRVWISAYNDPLVIAGQATVALEAMEQLENQQPLVWVVPVGGGGLIAGIGAALRARGQRARLVGVQPTDNAFMKALFYTGSQDGLKDLPSLADGLTGAVEPQSVTIPLVKSLVDEIVTVSEEDIARAIAWAWYEHRQVIEGSGAVSLAALLFGQISARPALAVVTGGNIDPARHATIVRKFKGAFEA